MSTFRYDRAPGEFVLSTGRTLPASFGLLSLNAELQLFEGYDCYVYTSPDDEEDGPSSNPWFNLTQDERREIAEYQIGLWQRWADVGSPR